MIITCIVFIFIILFIQSWVISDLLSKEKMKRFQVHEPISNYLKLSIDFYEIDRKLTDLISHLNLKEERLSLKDIRTFKFIKKEKQS